MQVKSVSMIALHVVYSKRYVFTSNCSKEKDMLKFYGCKVGRSSERVKWRDFMDLLL